MSLFDKMLKDNETLFLNPVALDYDYQPKLVPYRENHQKYVASCIKPLFQNRNGKNLLVFGKPGVGKTVSIRHVLNELEEYEDKTATIFINCWKKDTTHKIVVDICEQIGYTWTQNKNTDDLIREITKILNKKSAVIVLDEFDKLNDLQIVYTILEDIYKKTIILITNETNFITKLDPRIKSRLILDQLEFKPYSLEETEGILRERRDFAFIPNIFDEQGLKLIVKKTFETGDVRLGLFLLKESANIAENSSLRKVANEHINEAIAKLDDFKKNDLDQEYNELLEVIKNNSGKTTKEVFDYYSKINNMAYRTFQRKVKDLESSGMISLDEVNDGKSRTFLVNFKTSLRKPVD